MDAARRRWIRRLDRGDRRRRHAPVAGYCSQSARCVAISAQAYLFDRPFFTGGSSTVQIPRSDLGPWELTHRNRAYYYFTLAVLVVVLLLVGHLRRTGIGRAIVGVREKRTRPQR